jgi:hypothetical protein
MSLQDWGSSVLESSRTVVPTNNKGTTSTEHGNRPVFSGGLDVLLFSSGCGYTEASVAQSRLGRITVHMAVFRLSNLEHCCVIPGIV